jgi:hypothetical protein
MQRVTKLEPRTPHQPGKLQKLSKNEFVVLLSFLESIKKVAFYLLRNQSSAGRPQAGAAFTVQFANNPPAFFLPRPRVFPDFFHLREGGQATVQILRL